MAAIKGHAQAIKVLLEHNANPYALDYKQWMPLHYASFHNRKDCVKILSYYDADIGMNNKVKNSRGQLAKNLSSKNTKMTFSNIWTAAGEGNIDLVRKYIEEGANLNDPSIHEKSTPLMLAAKNGQYLVAKFLLENGANKSLQDVDGFTAYDYSCQSRNKKLMYLLEI